MMRKIKSFVHSNHRHMHGIITRFTIELQFCTCLIKQLMLKFNVKVGATIPSTVRSIATALYALKFMPKPRTLAPNRSILFTHALLKELLSGVQFRELKQYSINIRIAKILKIRIKTLLQIYLNQITERSGRDGYKSFDQVSTGSQKVSIISYCQ